MESHTDSDKYSIVAFCKNGVELMIWHPLFQNLPTGLVLQHPADPQKDYLGGTSTVTKPSLVSPKHAENRPVQAQDLAAFKSDTTTLIKDGIQSSLSNFASQFKSDTEGKGESSQDHESSQYREPSLECVYPLEGEERELGSDQKDPELNQGDPNLDQLMLTEEEQKDF